MAKFPPLGLLHPKQSHHMADLNHEYIVDLNHGFFLNSDRSTVISRKIRRLQSLTCWCHQGSTVSVFLCLCVCLCFSVCVCWYLCSYVCVCFLRVCLLVPLHMSVCVSVFLCVSAGIFSVCACWYLCTYVCVCVRVSPCVPASTSACAESFALDVSGRLWRMFTWR